MARIRSWCAVRRYAALSLSVALAALPEAVAAEGPTLVRLDGTEVSIAEIERRISELMAEVWLPGMSAIVVRDGAIAYRQEFGVRDARGDAAIGPATSFTGLSFSKTLTAYLTLRLVERGVIDLDRPLHEYLPKPVPEYDFYTDLAGDTRHLRITARHVLSHTTGWPNWRWFTPDRKLTFLFEPGARHSYSGEGFAYLQLALEEHTGKGFEELAREEIFEPLDLARSSMVWRPDFEGDYAEDHDYLGRPLRRDRRDTPSAAGSLQTTIGDYTRFLIAVLNSQGLQPATRDALLAPQVAIRHARMFGPRLHEETDRHQSSGLFWTLGWGRVQTPFGWAIFHTGNDRGSANYSIAWPEARAAVVLMGNSNRLEAIAQDVVELLSADRSSPFEFLGYDRWDGPRQRWLTTLAGEGAAAGRRYWESLGAERAEWGLDDDEAFRRGAETLVHFRGTEESLELHRWRRSLFPESAGAVRDQVRALLEARMAAEAVAELDRVREPLAEELAWFDAWARTLATPAEVPTERLESYAGEYEVRRFELRGDALFYGRDATPPEHYNPLVAMSEDTFVLPGVDFFRLRFETDESGRATRVVGLYEDGREDSNTRTAGPAD